MLEHIQRRTPTDNSRFIYAQSGKPAKIEYFNLGFSFLCVFCTANYTPAARLPSLSNRVEQ